MVEDRWSTMRRRDGRRTSRRRRRIFITRIQKLSWSVNLVPMCDNFKTILVL